MNHNLSILLKSSPRRSERGFSLVEVTVAIGLFTFALIPILGLMSHGVTTLRDSVTETTKAGIAKALMREAELTEWSAVRNSIGQVAQDAYFTMDGQRQTSEDGQPKTSADSETIYRGEIRWLPAPSAFGTAGQTLSALVVIDVEHFGNQTENLRLAKLVTRQEP
jgi:uncharacterized protein (TIGR02598 family)